MLEARILKRRHLITGLEVSQLDERAKDIIAQLINRLGFNEGW